MKNWGELEFPVPLNNIDIFKWNTDILVNVLAVKGEEQVEGEEGVERKREFYIIRKSKFNNQRRVADLLLLEAGKKRHYVAIKNLN